MAGVATRRAGMAPGRPGEFGGCSSSEGLGGHFWAGLGSLTARPPAKEERRFPALSAGLRYTALAYAERVRIQFLSLRQLLSSVSRDWLPRNPITGIVCCASAASGQVAAAPPANVMNCRRLIAVLPQMSEAKA
jgi:hypothetical protein